jgi:hypothetical protein
LCGIRKTQGKLSFFKNFVNLYHYNQKLLRILIIAASNQLPGPATGQSMNNEFEDDEAILSEERPPVLKKDWRFYTGMTALILSIVMPVFAFVVPLVGLSVAQSAVIVGLLVLGVRK